jgi:tetratricopeptide (TPR) repeat protein
LEQVKRLLLEELGTYLESQTEVKNYQLTKDQISTLAAGTVRTEIIEEKWDGKTYYLKAKISADPDEVAKSVDNLRKDTQKAKGLEENKNLANKYLEEIKQLRKELEGTKKEPETKIIKQYNVAVGKLSINDLLAKAIGLWGQEKYQEAIQNFNEIISKDPNDFIYSMRASCFSALGNHQRAIEDYNRAMAINPKETSYYRHRGKEYSLLGNNQQAIEDYNKAIEIEPNDPENYCSRGDLYASLKDYKRAIQNYDKALEIKSDDWWRVAFPQVDSLLRSFYHSARAGAYYALGDHQKAIDDFTKAIEMEEAAYKKNSGADDRLRVDPSLDYALRANVYLSQGEFRLAIQDLTRAIEINPNSEGFYELRGFAYLKLNENSLAITDLTKAIEMNPNAFQVLRAEAYRYRAGAYEASGNHRQAMEDIKEAARLGDEVAKNFLAKQKEIEDNTLKLICHIASLSKNSFLKNMRHGSKEFFRKFF